MRALVPLLLIAAIAFFANRLIGSITAPPPDRSLARVLIDAILTAAGLAAMAWHLTTRVRADLRASSDFPSLDHRKSRDTGATPARGKSSRSMR